MAGRPLLFQSVKDLDDKIADYFDRWKQDKRPYTLAGLALHLDCCTTTLRNYGENEAFFHSIKKAMQTIEASKAEKLESKEYSTAGLIFDLLNNHGYVNRQEVDNKSSDGSMSPAKLSEEQLDARIKELAGKL